MGKSIRATHVGPAVIKLGDTYYPSSEEYAEPQNLIDIGLLAEGVRIRHEIETVEHVSEQLRGPYEETIAMHRYFIEVPGDEFTIFNLALGWGYDVSDVTSSSVLILNDPADVTYKGLVVSTTTTKKTSTGQAGTREFVFGRVAIVENVELNFGRGEKSRVPLVFKAYVDVNGKFGEIRQTVQEIAPSA